MSHLLDSAATLDPVRRADLALNDNTMREEMQELINLVKARRVAQERPVVKPLAGHIPAYVETRTCCLCGDPSPTFTCKHCNAYMENKQ